ncbi:siphovirus ReqiPepy6 Gp37-like family protein [Cytobacillus sp. Hm23]
MIYIKPIRILTSDMQLLAEIDDYESLIFTRRFHNVGEFELHINRHKQHTDKLIKDNLILLGSDLHKVGIIKHREIGIDDSGKQSETWVIRGLEIKGIVSQRITLPPSHTAYDNKSGDAETVLKHYVDRNIVNPEDLNRKISVLDLADNLNRGQSITWQSRFKNLSEELTAISYTTGIGWGVHLDIENKKWLFDVHDGRDLTSNQTENPPVIFSHDFDSLKSLQFTESEFNYRNQAYVAGQGEGINRRVVEIGNLQDLQRIETFIDARDIAEVDENEQPIPEQDIINALNDRGNQKLQEFLQEQFLEGQILTHSPFVYEKDYDLGDIVTIQNKDWGVTMDARITEITEVYETGGFQLEATFGNAQPTFVTKLKQELNQIDAEIKR